MKALRATIRERYPKTVLRYIREKLPEQAGAMSEKELEEKVRTEVKRAMDYGVAIEWDVCRYVYFEFLYGPRFDQTCSWAKKFLVSGDLSSTKKMDGIESYHLNYLKK
jgi:hypothetical protein